MKEVTRFFAILAILALALIPEEHLQIFKKSEIQLVMATLVGIALVMHDIYAGLLLGVGVLIVYYRLYNDIFITAVNERASDVRDKGPMACIMGSRYITDEDLKNAQDNIVDSSQLDTQIVGIPGINSEQVFGAQGMYKKISGIDTSSSFSQYADAQFK